MYPSVALTSASGKVGAGVVAIVYPIQPRIPRTPNTATKAVTCKRRIEVDGLTRRYP